MASRDKTRRLCFDAMLLSLALILSYLEFLLPLTLWIPLPGFKLGLSNIIITLVFVTVSPWDAAVVSLARISVMALLFGNVQSFFFALCGGLLSYLGLWLLARVGRRRFSMLGVSVGCAALHNLGQLLCASLWFGTSILLGYLPVLLIAALLFGTVTGVLLQLLLPRFSQIVTQNKKYIKQEKENTV